MKYSIIYGHLDSINVKVGQILTKGTNIGIMGTTGCSTGIHLHISVIENYRNRTWGLNDMASILIPSKEECLNFINNDLFGSKKYAITNGWLGYSNHFGYDVISKDSSNTGKTVYWNRDFNGIVVATGSQLSKENGWGNYIIVNYEVKRILKYKIGDKIILNGYLYNDSYGTIKGKYMEKYIGEIGIINDSIKVSKPYNIKDRLGWVSEEDISLYKEENIIRKDNIWIILLSILKHIIEYFRK